MNLTAFTLKNKPFSWFALALVIFGGIFAYLKIGKLEDAPFTIKQAVVLTTYPGASAEEVEEQVTDKLEEAIQSLGELDYVQRVRLQYRLLQNCNGAHLDGRRQCRQRADQHRGQGQGDKFEPHHTDPSGRNPVSSAAI